MGDLDADHYGWLIREAAGLQAPTGRTDVVGEGDYFLQVWPSAAVKPEIEARFDAFSRLATAVVALKMSARDAILRVHLPACATDQERATIINIGGQLF